jgi:TRAP transporter TAXI family solute receptor
MRNRALAAAFVAGAFLALLPLAARAQDVTKPVTIGAASLGGVYYIWGGAFSELLRGALGVDATVQLTGGPVGNIKLLEAGVLDFGMITTAPAHEGWHGLGWAEGKRYRNARVLFPMYTSYFQMYALERSGIRSIHDLNGKRVGVGPVGGTPATYWPAIFDVAGVKPRAVNSGLAYLDDRLRLGTLDAHGSAIGLPWGLVSEIATDHPINLFGVPPSVAEAFVRKYPFFGRGEIPANTYKGQRDPIPTLTLWNFMAVRKDAPDDLVYRAVKATFERLDILAAAHKSAREVRAENIVLSPIPLHPAAARYYQEKGIALPEALLEAR